MDIFEAVAEPRRREMLGLLAERDRSVGEIVESFHTLSQPAVSQHLRVLRDIGLVRVRTDGQRRIYTLRPARLMELDAWLDRYRRYWTSHLNALEQHLADFHGNDHTDSERI